MPSAIARFFSLASSRSVVVPAARVSALVGTLLALINHGGALLQQSLSPQNILQILLSYLVPYCVSTYSAVKAIQSYQTTGNSAERPDND